MRMVTVPLHTCVRPSERARFADSASQGAWHTLRAQEMQAGMKQEAEAFEFILQR